MALILEGELWISPTLLHQPGSSGVYSPYPWKLRPPLPSHSRDAHAFGELVRHHAGMVFATAKRVTRDAGLAEDVAQETFLELARNTPGAVECVAAWLHRVAWRKACNAIRGESRRRLHEQAAATLLHAPADEWQELEPLLDEALEELPAHLREPLVLHYLEGRTQKELAAGMGVSQSTVSRQLDAAIQKLRSRLRTRGVLSVTALSLLLSSHAVEAAPPSLTAALGRLALSGTEAAATTSSLKGVSTFIAMTATTKALLATAAVAAISLPVALHRPPSSGPPTAQKLQAPAVPATPKPAAQQANVVKAEPAEGRRHYRPAPVSAEVQQKVEAIIRRHQGMTLDQLMKSDELNALMGRTEKLLDRPETRRKVEEALADLKNVTGAEHGHLSIGFDSLDDAKGRAWVEAAVSEDPARMEAWLINRFNGSIFEFALEPGLKKTSEGISIVPAKRPALPADAASD